VSTIFDDAAALDRDNPSRVTQRGQPVGDDDHGPLAADPAHVLLNDPLAFVI
jgi:hypothetical protein